MTAAINIGGADVTCTTGNHLTVGADGATIFTLA